MDEWMNHLEQAVLYNIYIYRPTEQNTHVM